MTNHWIDIKNSDAILIMGSNAAEHHPIAFKWIMKAKERGATLMHVDPKFSRTSARCDFHVPLRSGTDIAFLGGMIRYIFDTNSWFREYVLDYTNASFILDKGFGFSDGLFTGYDSETRRYDKQSWRFELDANGVPLRDETLQNPRCVLNVLKKHYERYTLDSVSAATGVSKADLVRVYDIFCATGKPNKAGTMLYALGWTQHTVGVQNIRSAAIIQMLLGNIGVSGGGINALRGEPNVQGSTDHALLYDSMPGYHKAPLASWQTLADYHKANTPVSRMEGSVNWWQNRPKYVNSLLKAWYGHNATPENDFCYGLLPKLADGEDYSYMYIMDRVFNGQMRGGFIMGVNPMNSFPNTHKMRAALDNLDWLVVTEIHNSETSDNWRRPGADPSKVKTEVFLLPSAHRIEKEGTISNSGRWLQWFDKAVEPEGEARNFGDFWVPFINLMREMYVQEGGACPEQLLKMRWYDKFDASYIAKRINGQFEADCVFNGKKYRKGQQVPMFTALKDDGTTSSLNWLYAGSWTEEDGNKSKRRDPSQTPMQANIGLFPNWSWCWPQNRRILYNRASVDKDGRPWDPTRAIIEWKDGKWVGDTPDGAQPPMAESGVKPFIMTTDGLGLLFATAPADGPLPEHYEPAETPIREHPFSSQLSSPCYKYHRSAYDKMAEPADPTFPYVLTTYSLTEHWCGGGETRAVPNLLETEPQLYVEMSHELAREKGIKNGDGVVVESPRGAVEAIAMVTIRIRPFEVMGRTVHLIGMPFAYGWTTPGCGDSTNRLTIGACDPNTTIPELKACCVNIRKATKLTEIA